VRRNSVVEAGAWLEIIVGATLVAALNVASQLLFAAAPEGVGAPIGASQASRYLPSASPVCVLPTPDSVEVRRWVSSFITPARRPSLPGWPLPQRSAEFCCGQPLFCMPL
jgi:hypothetical protein